MSIAFPFRRSPKRLPDPDSVGTFSSTHRVNRYVRKSRKSHENLILFQSCGIPTPWSIAIPCHGRTYPTLPITEKRPLTKRGGKSERVTSYKPRLPISRHLMKKVYCNGMIIRQLSTSHASVSSRDGLTVMIDILTRAALWKASPPPPQTPRRILNQCSTNIYISDRWSLLTAGAKSCSGHQAFSS